MRDQHQPPQPTVRQAHRFGPIGLFHRVVRWHTTAPLWQLMLLTLVLLGLIVLVWSGVLGGSGHR